VPRLPSLDLVAETVQRELDAQERRGDALDSKAGVILGFAGVLVGLTVKDVHGTLAMVGAFAASFAGVAAGLAFIPRGFPTLKLGPLRLRYLATEASITRLNLLDTQIAMYQETLGHLRVKALLVQLATVALAVAVVSTVLAGTLGRR
jgi:hypothetical protein